MRKLCWCLNHPWQELCANITESTPSCGRRDPSRVPLWFLAFEKQSKLFSMCNISRRRVVSKESTDIHLLGSCSLWLSVSLRVSDPYAPRRNGGPDEPLRCPFRSVSNHRWLQTWLCVSFDNLLHVPRHHDQRYPPW